MGRLQLGVLGSGSGSNMQSIVDAIEAGTLDADIKLVLADVPDAKILERARRHSIPCEYLDCAPWKTKLEGPAEDKCIEMLKAAGVDTVVLAGFMRIVKPKLLSAFPDRGLNIHPALLPAFPGVHSWTQALDYGCKVAGVTVHFVDAGTDSGPIIVQKAVEVLEAGAFHMQEVILRDLGIDVSSIPGGGAAGGFGAGAHRLSRSAEHPRFRAVSHRGAPRGDRPEVKGMRK